MINSAYNWIGLGVGLVAILLAASALVQDFQQRPLDLGTIGFTIGFAFFWAVIAASCAYGLLHSRGQAISSGCLFIVLVVGGLLALTGAALLVPRIAEAQQADRLEVAIFLGLGAILLVPSSLLLWHRRRRSPQAASIHLWQGIVAGVLTAFLGGAVLLVTTGDPYDIGPTAHLVLAAIMGLGLILVGACGAALWRGRNRERAAV
ncbi:MAG TPA: hypothetical protein VK131_05010 [Candidatus Acidoferrales bacterium]|nr:hypothetical protein [Candidatus Acidoferrales bacterium]